MDKNYRGEKVILLFIMGIIFAGIGATNLIRSVFPDIYTGYLWIIPAYFLLSGVVLYILLSHIVRGGIQPARAVARLMVFNAAQMVVSFALVACYVYFIDMQRKTVLVSFVIYYVLFMGLKMFILLNVNKKKQNEQDTE
ncbi:MAG: hypothetical protein LBT42_09700 [Tannerella sp.]|nr:hypothetical protein [Tannerella sp.]